MLLSTAIISNVSIGISISIIYQYLFGGSIGPIFFFRSYRLIDKELLVDGSTLANKNSIHPSVWRLRFRLPVNNNVLGIDLGLGEHVKVKLPSDYSSCSNIDTKTKSILKPRSYSPSSSMDAKGYFELTIKEYPQGCYSKYLASLSIGDDVLMSRGWPLPASFMMKRSSGKYIGIISMGIGITEAIWVANSELEKDDTSIVILLRANKYLSDLVLTKEIHQLIEKYPKRFIVRDIFSQESSIKSLFSNKPVLYGRIQKDVINEVFLKDILNDKGQYRFLVVGTKAMKKSIYNLLEEMGFPFRKHALLIKQFLPRI